MIGFAGRSLPLGADIGRECVALVQASLSRGSVVVREAVAREVPAAPETETDRKVAETVRDLAAQLRTRERRCILAVAPGDVVQRTFRIPPGMRRGEARRAAVLEADGLAPWPPAERLVALDPIPARPGECLLSVARRAGVERLVALARAGGLRPVAVDVPACVWRRAVPDTDALLDLTRERAELVIFREAGGTARAFPPRLVDERLAAGVRSALVEARRDGLADVRRLSLLATAERFEALAKLLDDDGYALAPVTCGEARGPLWAFAYGLATWPLGPGEAARA